MLNSDSSALIKGGVATTYEQMRDARRKRKKKSRMTRFRMVIGAVAISFVIFFISYLSIVQGFHEASLRKFAEDEEHEIPTLNLEEYVPGATVVGFMAAVVAAILRAWW